MKFTLMCGSLQIRNHWIRDALAEYVATFIFVLFAIGSGAQLVLSRGTLSSPLGVQLAAGCALTMAIYTGGNASGAYVNPAVAMGFCFVGKLQWRKYPMYLLCYFAGGFTAAATVYGIYYDKLNDFDGGHRQVYGENGTAIIFASMPAPYLGKLNGFFDIVLGNGLLVGITLAIADPRNMAPYTGLAPICFGLVVFAVGSSFGLNCGFPINGMRDFSPRVFMYVAGWGPEVFSHDDYWFWVPILGTTVGGVVSSVIYQLSVGIQLQEKYKPETDTQDIPLQERYTKFDAGALATDEVTANKHNIDKDIHDHYNNTASE